MQSKTSFFNRTLFRKNLTRYWPLWGLASFFGAQVALALWTTAFSSGIRGDAIEPAALTELYYRVVSVGVPVISLVYAVLCAAAVWGYLYTARSVGFMHSLPIRREGIFLTNYLSGIVMMLIPYAVTGGITILFSLLFRAFDPVGVLITILAVLGESFFFFSLATLTAFVTGSAPAMPILYGIFNFLAAALDGLASLLAKGFIFGLSVDYTGTVEFLSPVIYLIKYVSVARETVEVPLEGDFGVTTFKTVSVSLQGGWVIAVYALAGVILTAAALLLYRRRRSETAGDVVAVGWMKPVFLWGVAVCAALSGGQAIYAMFFQNLFRDPGRYRVAPMAVCLLIAGAIGYLAARMLLEKTLRVFNRRTAAGIAFLALCSAGLCLGLRADPFGVEQRVPRAEGLQSATVNLAGTTYRLVPGEDDLCLEKVMALHRELIEHKTEIQAQQDAYVDDLRSASGIYGSPAAAFERWSYQNVEFTYRLRNGSEVCRRYAFYMDLTQMGVPETLETALDSTVSDTAMQMKRLHAADRYALSNGHMYLEPVNYGYDFSSHELQMVYEGLCRDAAAGNWSTDFFNQRSGECYALSLDLMFRAPDETWDHLAVTVYPEMTGTLDALKSLDFIGEDNLITYDELTRRINAGETDFWGGKEPSDAGWAVDDAMLEKMETMTPEERATFLGGM